MKSKEEMAESKLDSSSSNTFPSILNFSLDFEDCEITNSREKIESLRDNLRIFPPFSLTITISMMIAFFNWHEKRMSEMVVKWGGFNHGCKPQQVHKIGCLCRSKFKWKKMMVVYINKQQSHKKVYQQIPKKQYHFGDWIKSKWKA